MAKKNKKFDTSTRQIVYLTIEEFFEIIGDELGKKSDSKCPDCGKKKCKKGK